MSNTAEPNRFPLLFIKDTHPNLYAMIRDLSKKRFSQMISMSDITIEDHPSPDDFIYGAHLTMIQIAAKDLRITFKAHFDFRDIKSVVQKPHSGTISADVQRSVSCDQFKEYCNLVAGGIAQHLYSCGIVAGISLPIATGGFDEIISSDDRHSSRLCDYWLVVGHDFRFSCTAYAEIIETKLLDEFVYREEADKVVRDDIELL